MLKTKVIFVGISTTIPNIDWSVWDWSQFCPLCIAFLQISLWQTLYYWEEKSRSTCSDQDSFLQVDFSKLSSFWLRFLFNNLESQPRSIVATSSSILWKWRSNRSRRFAGKRRYVRKVEFPNDIGFPRKIRFPAKVGFVGEEKTLGKKRFLSKERFPSDTKF